MSSGPRSAYACLLPIACTSLDESFWLVDLHRFVNLYARIYFDDEGARTARSVAWKRLQAAKRRSSSAYEVVASGALRCTDNSTG
jgi:hypothetical protein